jgi:hypothetical protein
MAAHLCLGVGACRDCDPAELVIVELRPNDPTDQVARIATVIEEMPGVELDRPMYVDDVTDLVVAVLRVTDRKLVPEEHHIDPQDGPCFTGGILESLMEHIDCEAGSAGWLVH